MAKINHIWEGLEKKAANNTQGSAVKRLFEPSSKLYIHLGIFSQSSVHFLAFEVEEGNLSNYKCLPHIKGLHVDKMYFGDEKKGAVSLVLSASSSMYNQSFDVLSEDLIEHTKNESENNLISCLADRLGLWKKFFSEVPCEILSEEKQIGLAGELYFMVMLLNAGINKLRTVKCWKGFEHSSKDYIFSSTAAEVKVSKSIRSVKISSEDQLDESEYDSLYLCFSSIAYSNESEYSLNILADRIREQLSDAGEDKAVFEYGLVQYGYLEIHKEYYNRLFELKGPIFYLVKGGFPRIKKTELREGIASVKYIIDLSSAEEFECEFSEITDQLLELGGGDGN